MNNKPVLGVILGDACGVGPEIIAGLCVKNKLYPHCNPIIIGDLRILEEAQKVVKSKLNIRVIDKVEDAEFTPGVYNILDQKNLAPSDITVGEVCASAGKASGDMLMTALDLCKEGKLEGFVFAPLNKAALKAGGYELESENKLFGQYFGVESTCEVNILDNLWTSRVTSHIPIKDIHQHLTTDSVLRGIHLLNDNLKLAGVENPRLGIAALNPHGGEGGTCGREEIEVIIPAMEKATEEGLIVKGPYPADILFIKAFGDDFDGVVTMYHDQGQIALKLKGFQYGVTAHVNLPAGIVTAAHGSAFDIAGKAIATTDAMENAVKVAADMALGLRNRK